MHPSPVLASKFIQHGHVCKLKPYLAKPSQVASTLDWKRDHSKVLTISIQKHHFEVALCQHPETNLQLDGGVSGTDRVSQVPSYPSSGDGKRAKNMSANASATTRNMSTIAAAAASTHPSIIASKRMALRSSSTVVADEAVDTSEQRPNKPTISMSSECTSYVDHLLSTNTVCGIVVSWPLDPDTGRMGKECGRVLHMLEKMIANTASNADLAATDSDNSSDWHLLDEEQPSATTISYPPICLHSDVHPTTCAYDPGPGKARKELCDSTVATAAAYPDRWGRDPAYATKYHPSMNTRTPERIQSSGSFPSSSTPEQVWNAFCKAHWPALYNSDSAVASVTSKAHAQSKIWGRKPWTTSTRLRSWDTATIKTDMDGSALPSPCDNATTSISTSSSSKSNTVVLRSLCGGYRSKNGKLHHCNSAA